jgi:hypothetical protein
MNYDHYGAFIEAGGYRKSDFNMFISPVFDHTQVVSDAVWRNNATYSANHARSVKMCRERDVRKKQKFDREFGPRWVEACKRRDRYAEEKRAMEHRDVVVHQPPPRSSSSNNNRPLVMYQRKRDPWMVSR